MKLSRAWRIAVQVVARTFDDGFIHAGNMAYLSLTTLFPFFLIIAAVAGAFGRTEAGVEALRVFMETLPPDVATLLDQPIRGLIGQQTGNLLTFGIVVGLWSAASFVETIRDIIRRAFGVTGGTLWKQRLGSVGAIIVAVLLLLIAFTLQFVLVGIEEFVSRLLPRAGDIARLANVGRFAPALLIFAALYALFRLLTPARYRGSAHVWPGALLTTIVWMAATTLLPAILGSVANYQMTYGSLAGVMISLLFFYVVGLGLVTGAHLNAVTSGIESAKARERKGEPTA